MHPCHIRCPQTPNAAICLPLTVCKVQAALIRLCLPSQTNPAGPFAAGPFAATRLVIFVHVLQQVVGSKLFLLVTQQVCLHSAVWLLLGPVSTTNLTTFQDWPCNSRGHLQAQIGEMALGERIAVQTPGQRSPRDVPAQNYHTDAQNQDTQSQIHYTQAQVGRAAPGGRRRGGTRGLRGAALPRSPPASAPPAPLRAAAPPPPAPHQHSPGHSLQVFVVDVYRQMILVS